MNSSSTAQQTAQTAENILSEQKSFQSVQYAITGCREADTIAGVVAVLNTTGLSIHSLRGCQRVFEYLASLYKDSADNMDRIPKSWESQQAYSSGSLGSGMNQGLGPLSQVNPIHNTPSPYLTASQTLGEHIEDMNKKALAKQLAELAKQDNGVDEIWKIKP